MNMYSERTHLLTALYHHESEQSAKRVLLDTFLTCVVLLPVCALIIL